MKENELVQAALQEYGMTGEKAKLIRHNENLTYCVDGKYLLRIHKPKSGFDMGFFHRSTDAALLHEGELHFMLHLRSCGLPVQMPLKNLTGKLVTKLPDGTPATMLTWLPGETLEHVEQTPDIGHAIGKMLGKLHRASAMYQPVYPELFNWYDRALCERLRKLLTGYYTAGSLEMSFFKVMDMALRVVGEELEARTASYILVHSDLSLSNMLLTEQGIIPIDFSLQGYSVPMLDFGSLFCFLEEPCQKEAVRGYEEVTGTSVDQRLIDCCLSLQILLSIALHYPLWAGEPWFQERLPVWCKEVFAPLTEKAENHGG